MVTDPVFVTLGLARVAPEKPECLTACQSHYSDAFKGRHMNPENWKAISGYEGYYEISDLGNVRALRRIVRLRLGAYLKEARPMKPHLTPRGYLTLTMSKEGKITRRYVHQLVCEAFLERPLECTDVNHKNGVKADNRLENLEWATRAHNCQHALSTGLRPRFFTPEQIRAIRAGAGSDICCEDLIFKIRRRERYADVE